MEVIGSLTLEEKARNYIILGRFLKSLNVSNDELGKIFSKFIEEVDFADLNIYTCKEPVSFCDVVGGGYPAKGGVIGCNPEVSEEDEFKTIVDYLLFKNDR